MQHENSHVLFTKRETSLMRFSRSVALILPHRFSILLLLLGFSKALFASDEDRPPNLIWIMADDLGYGELGCYGQQIIQTPRLDQMAREGMRFTRFYAGATVCAPSRSVLMSGLHQGHTRVRGNAPREFPARQALRSDDLTVAKLLQQAGYRTALVGKWGLGDIDGGESGLPRRQGFDAFFGFLSQLHAHNHYPDFLWRNEERVQLPNRIVAVGTSGAGYASEGIVYADDLFAEEAIRFITENRDHPIFLYWSMTIPHSNNERAAALGDGADVPDYGPYADQDWPNPTKGHAAMITRMDAMVGKLLDQLDHLGLSDNTLVIFTSDNGPHRESRQDPEFFKPNGPFSGYKRSLKDGGIRVPMLARWPSRITPNQSSDHVAYFGDWMATAAELARSSMRAPLDSISFVPTLLGRADDQRQHEFLYWEFHEGGFQQAALFRGRWKGIRYGSRTEDFELYDQSSDVQESVNVAKDHPEVAAIMLDYLASARSHSEDWPIVWRAPN